MFVCVVGDACYINSNSEQIRIIYVLIFVLQPPMSTDIGWGCLGDPPPSSSLITVVFREKGEGGERWKEEVTATPPSEC